jgi:hypothetical protein
MPHSIAFNPIWLLAALLIALLDLACPAHRRGRAERP